MALEWRHFSAVLFVFFVTQICKLMRIKLAASFFCALLSVMIGFFFLDHSIFSLPLWLRLVCAFALSFAATFAVLYLLIAKDTGGVVESRGPDAEPESSSVPDGVGKRGYEVYLRVQRYMEEKRPYLDEKLNLESFSKGIFSNTVYVSRTINYYSGRNFRQFVNWYRIQYALDLMRKDPHLKMEEVSSMSGFHSTVSFNMAFRLFEGKTPTEWHEEYVDSLRKR